jgi:hypothetical protein
VGEREPGEVVVGPGGQPGEPFLATPGVKCSPVTSSRRLPSRYSAVRTERVACSGVLYMARGHDRLAEITSAFLKVQIEAGASAVQLFDSWVGALAPADYRRSVMPASTKVFESAAGYGVPRIHFGVGTGELLGLMGEASADVVGTSSASTGASRSTRPHAVSAPARRSRVGAHQVGYGLRVRGGRVSEADGDGGPVVGDVVEGKADKTGDGLCVEENERGGDAGPLGHGVVVANRSSTTTRVSRPRSGSCTSSARAATRHALLVR